MVVVLASPRPRPRPDRPPHAAYVASAAEDSSRAPIPRLSSNFKTACRSIGIPNSRFHHLRNSFLHDLSEAGATTREAGALAGFVDIVVNEILVIRGLRIMRGNKGLFVSMPHEQGKDNRWYDQVVCLKTELYDDIWGVVLAEYEKLGRK